MILWLPMKIKAALILLTLILSLCLFNARAAQSLILNLNTDKTLYDLGERITISGSLILGETPVTDGLVAIEVKNPRNESIILRTLTSGTEPPKPWIIEILDFIPCDSLGNPKTSFTRGGNAGFKITIKNNALSDYYVIVPVYIQYSDNTPFTAFEIYEGIVEAGKNVSALVWPIPIPDTAPLGTTYAYANPFNGYPANNGYAYSPEKVAAFQITLPTASTSTLSANELASTTSVGTYNTTFQTSPYGGMIGNYTVHAASHYSYYLITNQTTFTVRLIGDITGSIYGVPDGKVDVKDVSLVARAYGSKPGQPNWNPLADITGAEYLVPDGKVDVRDVSLVAKSFGKYGTLP
jgi:hypothetical protein